MKTKKNTKKKGAWTLVISLVGIATLLLSFIPVCKFLYGISICHYSTNDCWGPMGGPIVDETTTNIVFFLLMIVYLWLIAAITLGFVRVREFMKKV